MSLSVGNPSLGHSYPSNSPVIRPGYKAPLPVFNQNKKSPTSLETFSAKFFPAISKNHFFLTGLKSFPLHFLHLALPVRIFKGSNFILCLQTLQTKEFLNNLFCAAGSFVAIFIIE